MDPLTAGLLIASVGGGILTNRANAKEARRNREFQAQQSATAAQRSVADYRAAGLNPALAYGTTASTPSGSTAQQSDPVTPGIASARDAIRAKTEMQIAKADAHNRYLTTQADIQLKAAQADQARIGARLSEINSAMLNRANTIEDMQMPNMVKAAAARNLMAVTDAERARYSTELESLKIPGARNEANLQRALGTWGASLPWITSGARGASSLFNGIGSAIRGTLPLGAAAARGAAKAATAAKRK